MTFEIVARFGESRGNLDSGVGTLATGPLSVVVLTSIEFGRRSVTLWAAACLLGVWDNTMRHQEVYSSNEKNVDGSRWKGNSMRSCSSLFLLVSVVMLVGCSVRVESPPSRRHHLPHEHAGTVESDLGARIAAARSVSSFVARDRALSVIAVDAAHESDIYHAVKALSMISSFVQKDSAAEKCADVFLEMHMHAEAKKVAGQVSSFVTRDRILSKIAQTPAASPPD